MACCSDLNRVRRGEGLEGARLQREADLLQRARHPGVEELQAVSLDGDCVEIVTSRVAGVPPSQAVRSVDHVAGVIAVLATTVADLHEIGIAHGGISDEAVVVGSDGRPILVGFDQAIAIVGPSRRWPSAPAAAADVRAVGALAGELLRAVGATPRPPGGRWAARWARRRERDSTATLFELADSRAGLTARALADAVLGSAPMACLPVPSSGPADPAVPSPPERPERSEWSDGVPRLADAVGARARGVIVGGALALAALGITLVPLACQHHSKPAATTAPGEPIPADPASLADGMLTIGSEHFAIGGPGDEVVLGRWTCQPRQTALLLSAGTGRVWVFPTWATPDHPVQAVAVARVAGALRARSGPAGRCDDLLVTRADGSTLTLHPRVAS